MKISVIIPTLNEEVIIGRTIRTINDHTTGYIKEIIVVDGGSSDDTVIRAEEAGAKVVQTESKGRALQMNKGASCATSEVYYFLHADSLPPAGFDQKIIENIQQGYPSGCFRLAFDRDRPILNFYGWCTRFDIDAFRFGDQSLYVKRELFDELDGFESDLIVMEDNIMVRDLKKKAPFRIIPDDVTTSARKYERIGVIRVQLIFILIYLLFFMGFSQDVLVSTYKKMFSK